MTSTHTARITSPVSYRAGTGRRHHIPIGPCLIEPMNERCVDVIWGRRGERSAVLGIDEMKAAQDRGNLVLLD